jgi:N-methylhydantoinase B
VFAYGESTNALLLAMFTAMADAVGEDAIAGDMGAPNIHTAHGRRSDGSPWIAVGVTGGERGPWGATRAGDADSFSTFYQANSIDTAVEVSEADAPIVILRREYLADTAGVGANRGGAAVLKDSLFLEPAEHAVIALRFKQRPAAAYAAARRPTGGAWVWRRADRRPRSRAHRP